MMGDDACMRTKDAGVSKEGSGALVFLVEELGDARLRCAQLKKYVKDALDLIEKSEHKDHFFEVAGQLLYGIPDVLMRLDKSLDATALAAARLDYEEIKNGLRPEKADELESALNDTRLRYLNRRSTEDSMDRSAKLMSRQEAVLKKYLESAGSRAVMDYDALPADVKAALSKIKDQETLASDVDRWLMDNNKPPHMRSATTERTSSMNAKSVAYFLNKLAALTEKQGRVPVVAVMTLIKQLERGSKKASVLNSKAPTAFRNMAAAIVEQKNPSRMEIASVLRRIVGDTLPIGLDQAPQQGQGPQGQQQQQQAVQQQAPQQGQGQQQQQQAGAGEQFQKANPKITDEEAKVIDEMHDTHKDVVKDKNQ
jgi:hypothetical protein